MDEDILEANRKLHRRCQRLESDIAKKSGFDLGWSMGYEADKKASESREIRALKKAMQKQGKKNSKLKSEIEQLRAEVIELKNSNA
ncbi:MAG: hypothetical protein ACYSP9_08975 [Planctomycetota bacterium]|jgi:predicted RNase H-like nuclease (RuvC/YqgF family)